MATRPYISVQWTPTLVEYIACRPRGRQQCPRQVWRKRQTVGAPELGRWRGAAPANRSFKLTYAGYSRTRRPPDILAL